MILGRRIELNIGKNCIEIYNYVNKYKIIGYLKIKMKYVIIV